MTITSFDGTKIAAHWFVGKGVGAGDRAPTILEGPGWSQPGDADSESGVGVGAISLATWRWSPRARRRVAATRCS